MIRLISARKPKPSGKKKKVREPLAPEVELEEDVEVADEDLTKDERGVARSMANQSVDKQKREEESQKKRQQQKKRPDFVDNFSSSNIKAVAYDPEKKQMWVKFMGNDVYTYFDVPMKIYRGFWSAPSKGHYFWERIRKNKHIKYQKLTANLRWVVLADLMSLNSNKQANVASVGKSLKNKIKRVHPEWAVEPLLKDVFNGKTVLFDDHEVEIVGYGNKIRVNILNKNTGKIDFSTTTETDTAKIVDYIIQRIEKKKQKLAASKQRTNTQVERAAMLQLLKYLKEATPELQWSDNLIKEDNGYRLQSEQYTFSATEDGAVCKLTIYDNWESESYDFLCEYSEVAEQGLNRLLSVALQGAA